MRKENMSGALRENVGQSSAGDRGVGRHHVKASYLRLRRRMFGLVLALLSLALIAGCGGGGGGRGNSTPTPTPTPTPSPTKTAFVTWSVLWPARSRQVAPPASARSFVLTITRPDSSASVAQTQNNRQERADAYRQDYSTIVALPTGNYRAVFTCFADADGGGAAVGTATVSVTVSETNSDLGAFAVSSRVARVEVIPNQTVFVNELTPLAFTAFDADNKIVVVSPGSAFVESLQTNILSITDDQQILGAIPGDAPVRALVDGVRSASAAVKVTSRAQVIIQPQNAQTLVGKTVTLTATVTNAPRADVTWEITEPEGGTISTTGVYTAPAKTGTFHALARSVYDPEKTAQATILVQSNGVDVPIDFGATGDLPVKIN